MDCRERKLQIDRMPDGPDKDAALAKWNVECAGADPIAQEGGYQGPGPSDGDGGPNGPPPPPPGGG